MLKEISGKYTRGPSDRVSTYSIEIGKYLGNLNQYDLDLLRVGGTFHDIGKIGTTDDILLSDRKLTEDQFSEIKKHPLDSAIAQLQRGSGTQFDAAIVDKFIELIKNGAIELESTDFDIR